MKSLSEEEKIKQGIWPTKELCEDFIAGKYTMSGITKEFGISKSSFYRAMRYFGLNTVKSEGIKLPDISKEELIQYYITENHTEKECIEHFNLKSRSGFYELLRKYDIKKDLEQIVAKSKEKQREKNGGFLNMEMASFQDKCKQGVRDKYGVDNVFQSEEMKEKIKSTFKERYGVEHYSQTEEYKEKFKNTSLERFGTEHPFQNEEVKDKIKETMIDKYGAATKSFSELDPYTQHVLQSKENFEEFLKEHPNLSTKQLSEILKCSTSCVLIHIKQDGLEDLVDLKLQYSNDEKEVLSFLKEQGIKCIPNYRGAFPKTNAEIDIWCPDYKIGIEFNGDYWHSDVIKRNTYHQEKSIAAQEVGIRLIHIYEYEWRDLTLREKIKAMLLIAFGKIEHKIYARKCEIRQISNAEARALNEKVHLQGHRNAQVTYGLFYNNELVQLMSFSKTKYNRNLKTDNSWEIIRGCPGSNNTVVGGVSKLFSRFVKDYNPDMVFSYCDFNKFDGKSYEAIGMRFIGYTVPDLTYIKNGIGYKRRPMDGGKLRKSADFRVYGAGSKKYIWTRN